MTNKKPNDFTIFRYSTILALSRAGLTTFDELDEILSHFVK